MFRVDLQFLEKMFPEGNYKKYHILIINQTDEHQQLTSDLDTIRIINTETRGLPESRNLAIQNALGEICLIADDDVQYVKNFESIILDAYVNKPDAIVQTFEMTNPEGKLYRDYPNVEKHTQKSIKSVNSVVITFKPSIIRERGIFYNLHFGLGAIFGTGDEYVFMKSVLKAKVPTFFVPQIILTHPDQSSGQKMGEDSIIYARAALAFKYYGFLSYLWVFKYMRFLIAHQYIGFNNLIRKTQIGLAGIQKYRTLIKNGLEKR